MLEGEGIDYLFLKKKAILPLMQGCRTGQEFQADYTDTVSYATGSVRRDIESFISNVKDSQEKL